jgi:hypothetical protein
MTASLVTRPAAAGEPVFPRGARVGLVPLEGLSLATTFPGFEATDKRVKVVVTELPKEAFASVEAASKSDGAKADGAKSDDTKADGTKAGGSRTDGAAPVRPKLEPFELQSGTRAYLTRETGMDEGAPVRRFSLLVGGNGFAGYVAVQVPDNAGAAYSDEAVRTMLASTELRTEVPAAEQLERLPFRLGELGGFKTMRTLPTGATVLLTDATEDEALDTAPYMLIGLVGNGPATPGDRGRFAEQLAVSLPGLRESRITSSEPLRIDGAVGYETRIDAVTGKENTPVTVVQWLRFGGTSTTLRIVAGARRDEWPAAFTRFRAVRDGIGPR